MARARCRLPLGLADLLKSEIEAAINEANLGRDDTLIAKMYLIDKIPQIDIGIELDLDRSTISKRLPNILGKVEHTAHKMNIS